MKKKIYIGCALTHASEEFKAALEEVKDQLRSEYEILDFLGLVNGTAQDVFAWDINCVKSCDLFIADCTYPSIGLGMEIGTALANNKPMLILAQEDAKVTRMVLGITHDGTTLKRYKDHSEVLAFIKEKLQTI